MTKLTSKEKFETSIGTIFIIEGHPLISIGEKVNIDEHEYEVKRIILPTRPLNKDVISVVVQSSVTE